MELIIATLVIWGLWALFSGGSRGSRSDGTQVRRPLPIKEADGAWLEKCRESEAGMPARRQRVLSALREDLLSQKQISNVLESASHFGFSPEELAELKGRLHPRKASTVGDSVCRVCGRSAMPGEDLCYSHQAK